MPRREGKRLTCLARTGLFVVVGIALAGGMNRWVPLPSLGETVRRLNPLLVLLVFAIAWAGGIVVHEGGHLVAGRLVGLRFSTIVLGPFALVATPSGWQPRFSRGALSSHPAFVRARLTGHENRARLILYMAGGPLAGILAGLAAHQLAMRVVWSDAHAAAGAGGLLLILFAIGSAGMSVISLLPLPGADGSNIVTAARRGVGPGDDREAAQLEFGLLIAAQTRPRAWPSELLDRLFPETAPVGDLLRYHALLDRGEIAEAGRHVERAVAMVAAAPAEARAAIWLENAYYTAFHRGDIAAAEAALERARKERGLVDPCTRLRAQAAVLLANGQRQQAFERAEHGLAAIARSEEGAQAVEEPLLLELTRAAAREPRAA